MREFDMAHYAKVENGVVAQVIVADHNFINTLDGEWIKTSFNTMGGVHYGPSGVPDDELVLRKNFAEIGGTYSRERDAFIPPKPYESCLLNEDTCTWEYPEPLPDVSGIARWDEASYQAGNGGWHEKKKHPEGSPVD
ncbi:MAG: hypothetical protein HOL17_02475 [Gammaproteobacteria bacterium]|nr:hypothetical protein [Gammaproteobacteria bacterium]MBT5370569.1 hypothetical protein [Gammaproteobacteria bacterium]MBT7480526.1 hypothetical protein [Gammaproteobacteria bacterium]